MNKDVILSSILDELFKGCKDCIIENFDKEKDKLRYLHSYITYYSTFNKKNINDGDYDILLKEVLEFLRID